MTSSGRSDASPAPRAVSLIGVVAIGRLLFDAVARPETGLLALANIVSPSLVLIALLLLSLGAVRGGRWPRIILVGLIVVTALRFGDEWLSMPATPGAGTTVEVATWNLELGSVGIETMRAGLATFDAEVVALEELTPDQATAIEGDATIRERYPYRALFPAAGAAGIGLVSSLPLSNVEGFLDPSRVTATIDLDGREIVVVAAHPFPALIPTMTALRIPVGFDPSGRDTAHATIRADIDSSMATDDVIVLGDFNTAPTEPAYSRLTAGLVDAHVAVGLGPGWTWRPSRLEFLGFGLLRIDLVLASPGLSPVRSWVDCSHPGDHCLVGATLQLRPERT